MDTLDKYKVELEVTGKMIRNASTWINGKCYLEAFHVTKLKEDEWLNKLFD